MSRRRVALAGAVFALLVAGGGVVTLLAGDGEQAPVPEAGSRLRGGGTAQAPGERTLLGALSALLERAAPESADPPRRAAGRRPRSARGLAARLPPSRLAAQVLLAGFEGVLLDSEIFVRLGERDFGGVVLEERNYTDPVQLATLAGETRVVALNAGHVPPVIAAAPHALPALVPPAPPRLRSPARARALAAQAGTQLRNAGLHLVLAPPADVALPGAPGEELAFGDEPGEVTALATASAAGYAEAGLGTAPGHFPGQGSAGQDPLQGPASVGLPREALRARDLRPFAALVRRVPAVVVSNASFTAYDPVTPAALTPAIVGGLLRRELRFRGVAIADNVLGAAAATGGSAGEAAVAALAAGCDMVYVRDRPEREQAYRAILGALRRGTLSEPRLREAVARVLELKRRLGLLGAGSQGAAAG